MSKHEPIIDVAPVASASAKAKDAAGTVADAFQAPSFGRKAARQAAKAAPQAADAAKGAQSVAATVIDSKGASGKKPSKLAGAVQTAAGGALMLVGLPMLILPGPGLLAIGGGAVVAAGGVKKLMGK